MNLKNIKTVDVDNEGVFVVDLQKSSSDAVPTLGNRDRHGTSGEDVSSGGDVIQGSLLITLSMVFCIIVNYIDLTLI